MRLTTEQKLAKCIEFIKKIETLDIPTVDVNDYIKADGCCNECYSDDVDVDIDCSVDVVLPEELEKVRDEAWHVLADITD